MKDRHDGQRGCATASCTGQAAEPARQERIPCGDLGNGYFRNPVLVGPGADNTVVRVGADFYMIAGGGWPDHMVWHSRDLVSWRPLTRALRQFNGRAYASDIVYHERRFHIHATQVDAQRGNMGQFHLARRNLLGVSHKAEGDKGFLNVVLWADDPHGP